MAEVDEATALQAHPSGLVLPVPVHEDAAADEALRLAAGEDVHQGGLAGASGAHQRGQHAWLRVACTIQAASEVSGHIAQRHIACSAGR